MEANTKDLERRYQILFGDFQSGKIDEATFMAEVDKLQFRDDWGRYWMLGAQTGAWHYYDGQTWHQADPAEADKLPFMDDQGRYWQRGAKSGDWYYYQPEADEWVKPGEDDPPGPSSMYDASSGQNAAFVHNGQWPNGQPFGMDQPAYTQAQTGAQDPNQFGAELFQDDEGRYWAVGAKTGQWYFYDDRGWHSANEFQSGMPLQTQQSFPYQSQPTAYTPSIQQPPYQEPFGSAQVASTPQPYQAQPQQPVYTSSSTEPPSAPQSPVYQQAVSQPAPTIKEETGPGYVANSQPQPTPADAPASEAPVPPQGSSQSGTWFYFDGKQWLKYSTGEPAEVSPPDPGMILDQESDVTTEKTGANKSESIVAEFFEDDEPPVEVVDVEVITVVEAEPDPDPVPDFGLEPDPEPVKESVSPAPSIYSTSDEVRPRRSRSLVDAPVVESTSSPDPIPARQVRKRAPSDPVRPVTPRKKSTAHEPTIIIPTGATTSGISSPSSARVSRPNKQRSQSEQRRAREATIPMAPVPLPGPGSVTDPTPVPASGRHRQVTQAMPTTVTRSPVSRPDSGQVRVAKRTRQSTENVRARTPTPVPVPVPASQSATQPTKSQKEGYTFGDVLRFFPSTFWTWAAGISVLIIVAAFIIIIGAAMFPLSDNSFGVGGVVSVESPTPTLGAALSDSTPTPGPTPTVVAEAVGTPTPVSLMDFSSSDLGFTLKYPEDWQNKEGDSQVIFSPSEEGLDFDQRKDSNIRIGISSDSNSGISDLLTEVLAEFPLDSETLNEGTISIASQTWTSTQIRFDDETLGGQGIATLAVTNKDGVGYYLIAGAPSEEWNSIQPLFQGVINSFRFGQVVAQNSSSQPTSDGTTGAATAAEPDEVATLDTEEQVEATPAAVTPQPIAVPETDATPVVHIVESGDTLLGIAVQYGVDVDLLASENGITDPGSLQLGQEFTIPFTAEELAAYGTNQGGTGTALSNSGSESGSEAETAETAPAETNAGETASAETASSDQAVSEEPAPPGDAVPISGKIVYPAFDPGRITYDVWMVDIATGEQTPIVGDASQPAFNKDGSLLAYRSWDLGTRGIFFRDFVGGRGGKVTDFVEDGMPAWSPDGFTFAFSSRKEGDRVARIYVGNQLGEQPFGLAFQGEYPATFSDGRLVVKGCTPTGDCGIFIMGASGGGEKKISGEAADTAPAPSPDGSKVAFMSSGRGGNNWEIWVMNADGSNPQRLTENGSNEGLPTWSPDGQSIAFVSDQGGLWGIWIMNADGSNQRKLVDMKGSPDGIVLHDEPNSKGWLEERISWAP